MDIKVIPRRRKTFYYVHFPIEQVVSGALLEIWDHPQIHQISLYDAFDSSITNPVIPQSQTKFNVWLKSKINEVINLGVPIILETPNERIGEDIIIVSVLEEHKVILRPKNLGNLVTETKKKFMTRTFDFYYLEPDLQIEHGDIETVDGIEETVQDTFLACMDTAFMIQISGARDAQTVYRTLMKKLTEYGVVADVRVTDNLRVVIDLETNTFFTTIQPNEPTPLLFHTEVR